MSAPEQVRDLGLDGFQALTTSAECGHCVRMKARMESAIIDSENAEIALRVERRKVKNLLKELEQRQLEHVRAADVEVVFLYWRTACKHERAVLGAKRRKAIAARLDDGYAVSELKLAIDGAAADAFVNGKGKRFDDIDLICRDEVKLEDFMERGRLAREKPIDPRQLHLSLVRALEVLAPLVEDRLLECLHTRCPICRLQHSTLRIFKDTVFCGECEADSDRIRQFIKDRADSLVYYGEEAA